MASTFGKLKEFEPQKEDMATYLERLQLYFECNGVEEAKKVSVMLTVIGNEVYSAIRSLVAPAKPKDKTFDELLEILLKHYDPKPLVIAERFRFYQRCQAANESVADFLAAIRRLSIRCEFNNFLDQALRDRFVCGIRSEAVQRKLLAMADLTLARALQEAQGMEAAEKDSKELKGGATEPTPQLGDSVHYAEGLKKPCRHCGRKHPDSECKFRNAECHRCGKPGHIAPVCKSGSRPGQGSKKSVPPPFKPRKPPHHQKKKKPSSSTQWVDAESTESDHDSEPWRMFAVRGSTSQPPIPVELEIDDKSTVFEVDTGATISVMAEKVFQKLFRDRSLQASSVKLTTYTGDPIEVCGEVQVRVRYQKQTPKVLPLVIVNGSGPSLLGRNWLPHIQLDWSSIKQVQMKQSLDSLLREFRSVFGDELGTITPFKVKLSLHESASPRFHKPRPVPFALKPGIEAELDRLERAGVLEKVEFSEWAAPIVPVPKKDNNVRICGDYRVTVNPILDVNQYPLPRPDELFATLAGGKSFTKLDLSHAYNQLVLEEKSRQVLTINTHRGLYRYTRLPFGVASAPAVFQKCMDQILQGLEGVICYIDDILITGKTETEHLGRLEKVLQRLQKHGVRAKRSKCAFLQPSVQYLGHRIDAEGVHPVDTKLQAIREAPAPRNLHELRSFLGLLNYYGRFIPNLSTLLHPLNELQRRDTPWKWTKECKEAFKAAKSQLMSPTILAHYDATLPIRLAGDASAYGVGAVISHVMPDGSERPIAFASRTLLPAERNYSQIEKEALSLIFGVTKFHRYLYGRRFTLITDHKPLTTILGPKKGVPSVAAARLQRWAVKLAAYTYDIKFRCTSEHSNADALSRLPINRVSTEGDSTEAAQFNINQLQSLPVTATQLAGATRTDKVLSKVYQYITKGWPHKVDADLNPFFQKRNELTVEGDCILWGTRVIIPHKWRERLLQELHHDHPGICKMKSTAQSYIWWPKIDLEIEHLAKQCVDCQAVKNSPPLAPLHPWSWPSRVFQRVHVDFAGPFQGAMFLVIVDAYSKWPEAFMMKSTTADNTIEVLRHVFSSYGLPEQLVSDNGSQFTSEEFAIFLKENGIKHTRGAPYHPSTNGLAERFVQSMKQGLKASQTSKVSLSRRLHNFLLTYRSSVHSTTGVTPASLFLKREVRTRFDLLKPDRESRVLDKQAQQKADHDVHSRFRQFEIGDMVMAKNFRQSGSKWIPAVVVKRLGPLSYLVETSEKQLWRRHIDHLRDGPKSTAPTVPSPQQDSNIDSDDDEMGPVLPNPRVRDVNSPPPEAAAPQASTPAASPAAATAISKYPQRTHVPPDYLRPTF